MIAVSMLAVARLIGGPSSSFAGTFKTSDVLPLKSGVSVHLRRRKTIRKSVIQTTERQTFWQELFSASMGRQCLFDSMSNNHSEYYWMRGPAIWVTLSQGFRGMCRALGYHKFSEFLSVPQVSHLDTHVDAHSPLPHHSSSHSQFSNFKFCVYYTKVAR
jgi:hypothetical protein